MNKQPKFKRLELQPFNGHQLHTQVQRTQQISPQYPQQQNYPVVSSQPKVQTTSNPQIQQSVIESIISKIGLPNLLILMTTIITTFILAIATVIAPLMPGIFSSNNSNHQTPSPPSANTTSSNQLTTLNPCPSSGNVLVPKMSPLTLGGNQNIIFLQRQNSLSIIKRYDINTKRFIEIIRMPNTNVDDAQLSSNGQWVLFTANNTLFRGFYIIRIDGKDLQTLFCIKTTLKDDYISSLWSKDQKTILFTYFIRSSDHIISSSGITKIYVLDLVTGAMQLRFVTNPQEYLKFSPLFWLDNARLALVVTYGCCKSGPIGEVDILNFNNKTTLSVRDRQPVADIDSCSSNILKSPDGKFLFITHCQDNGLMIGGLPTTQIDMVPTNGGRTKTLYKPSDFSISSIDLNYNNNLLVCLENGFGDTRSYSIWEEKLYSPDLTKVSTYDFVWPNLNGVSPDGKWYLVANPNSDGTSSELLNAMNGGRPTTIFIDSGDFSGFGDVHYQLIGWGLISENQV